MTVRVRFSPAPTGFLHVGGARSALFNWMYARHTGGVFVLRVEDTDTDRSSPELTDAILDSLRWLGIDWDEEYRQSDRFDLYRAFADDLVATGRAYRCDCTRPEIEARASERGEARNVGYDGFCRDRSLPPGGGVVRFRVPDDGVTGWDDVIRGRVEFDNAVLEDFIIVRSNGIPMFHLANAYDDVDMGITHVIRGEDLVNTTPRVLLLRTALGHPDPPVYAHLPLIVNEKRQKLSKRRDDVSVGDYRARGFLPEAMRNYLLTLGWGPPDGEEIGPIERFVDLFELEAINNSPAFFDLKKLEHFNGEYIRAQSPDDFVERSRAAVPADIPAELYRRMAPFVQERLVTIDAGDIDALLGWIVRRPPEPDPKDWKKVMGRPEVPTVLERVTARLSDSAWTPAALEEAVLGAGSELGVKSQLPVRMAITGARTGIPLFEPMAELDRSEVLARLEAARRRLVGEA